MNQRDALMRLAASTSETAARVLEGLRPNEVERGEVSVLSDGSSPFASLAMPAVAAHAGYIDGASGGNVLVMTTAAARALAQSAPQPSAGEAQAAEESTRPRQATDGFSDAELAAVAEVATRVMAAAASVTSVVLGEEVDVAPVEMRVLDRADEALELYGAAPHATTSSLSIAGAACWLVQLVPTALVVRMTRALDELSMEHSPAGSRAGDGASGRRGSAAGGVHAALRDIRVRVWAELGRTKLPLGRALELPPGALVELDHSADAPVDLFVNGLRFAHGHLAVSDDGEWAIRLVSLGARGRT